MFFWASDTGLVHTSGQTPKENSGDMIPLAILLETISFTAWLDICRKSGRNVYALGTRTKMCDGQSLGGKVIAELVAVL